MKAPLSKAQSRQEKTNFAALRLCEKIADLQIYSLFAIGREV